MFVFVMLFRLISLETTMRAITHARLDLETRL